MRYARHFAYVSSPGSIDQIRKAKSKGINVTCSVSPYNLILDETAVEEYDTHYKLIPPLKSKNEIKVLLKGLADGTIDTVASFHIPQDVESKKLEFDYAEFGMIGLETAYAALRTAAGDKLSDEQIVECLALNPAAILNIPQSNIEKNAVARLTLFDPSVLR